MSHVTDRLERDLREIAAGAQPSPSAWESIVARLDNDEASEVPLVLAPAPDRSKRPVWIAVAAAALLVITGSIALFVTRTGDDQSISTADPDVTNPSVAPPPTAAAFVGTWLSTDTDGSFQTMEIVRTETDEYEVVVRDDFASAACSGAPATMTGTGLLDTDERLVVAQPELTCDDGSIPSMGPPPQADLADFTLELDPATDEFVDSFGVVWRRAGSNVEPIETSLVTVPASASPNVEPIETSLVTVPAPALVTSGGMWPQSTLDEVRAAQELADAGDPAYTWQLDAKMAANEDPWGAEIFPRFIEEVLGWDEYISASSFGGIAFGEGEYLGIMFLRCAPGQTNPLSTLYAEAPFEIRNCAPTIDEFSYETVILNVSQPGIRGPSGIWVVDQWQIPPESEYDQGSLFGLLYPDFLTEIQVEQFAPPSDAEVTALLQTFLQSRVDGEGAEEYLLREPEGSWAEDTEVPLLYATTSGAPYERSEIELVQGPVWPTGWTEYKVRLFAEDETVVEQHFHVARRDGQLGLVYGYGYNGLPTTENGQSVAVPFTEFGRTVTFTAAPPLVPRGDGSIEIGLTEGSNGRVILAVDLLPWSNRPECDSDPNLAPSPDASTLARSVEAHPSFGTTETVPVIVAGVDGFQMDVVFSEENLCYGMWSPPPNSSGWRMRLYLVDFPESAQPSDSTWRPQVLTIAVLAPETDFERALEEATPIVESIEFLVP